MDSPKEKTVELARIYAQNGDPNGWFEEFYARAGGDIKNVYWADLEPGPRLISWLDKKRSEEGRRAVTVGCGLGDDAEALAACGYRVTAFDISESAIAMCKQRFPASSVDYQVADLFALPSRWIGGFDLVYECNTIQILSGTDRARSIDAIADLVAPGGEVLVSCRSREQDDNRVTFPIALDRNEIDGFLRAGLTEAHFVAYDDNQAPAVPHFFAVYQRQA